MESRVRLSNGWVRFTRIYCKSGFIDKWIGDCANDPNNDEISNIQLNSTAIYFRLNGKSKWVEEGEFKSMSPFLSMFKETASSTEIWESALLPPFSYISYS